MIDRTDPSKQGGKPEEGKHGTADTGKLDGGRQDPMNKDPNYEAYIRTGRNPDPATEIEPGAGENDRSGKQAEKGDKPDPVEEQGHPNGDQASDDATIPHAPNNAHSTAVDPDHERGGGMSGGLGTTDSVP